jgi:serine protease Do
MRALSRAVWLTLLMAIVVLSSVQCSQPSDAGDAVRLGAAANATTSSAQPLVTLPSFTALVKREGPAVVNISITWKVSVDTFAFPGFPGIQPDDPFLIFFALRC